MEPIALSMASSSVASLASMATRSSVEKGGKGVKCWRSPRNGFSTGPTSQKRSEAWSFERMAVPDDRLRSGCLAVWFVVVLGSCSSPSDFFIIICRSANGETPRIGEVCVVLGCEKYYKGGQTDATAP